MDCSRNGETEELNFPPLSSADTGCDNDVPTNTDITDTGSTVQHADQEPSTSTTISLVCFLANI